MSLLSSLERLWKRSGEPFSGLVRHIRYALLGRHWSKTNATHRPSAFSTDTTVAVVIPCHNYGRFLGEAIESVLAQTFPASDILVVDDASDDETREIASSFASRGVRYVRAEHRNLSQTRNTGASLTTSDFLVFLDADDRLAPNYIERCLEQAQDPRIAIVYADIQEFGDRRYFRRAPAFDAGLLIQHNYMSASSLLSRSALDEAGGYRVMEGQLEDWDLWQRIIAMGLRAAPANTVLFYRKHSSSMTSTRYNARDSARSSRAVMIES